MAMGKRKKRQESLWVAAAELPTSPGHPFYQKLNAILDAALRQEELHDRQVDHEQLGGATKNTEVDAKTLRFGDRQRTDLEVRYDSCAERRRSYSSVAATTTHRSPPMSDHLVP